MELSKEQFSNEVKAKYSFDKNTFSHTPKDDDKDRIKAEIGDEKQEDFLPQVKIQRWDNECNFSARLIHEETTPIIETEGDKIKWKGDKVEAHFYDMPEVSEDGGYEFEVILKEKPKTNVVKFSLQTKDLEFLYQPALTEKEIKEGANRPENIIGSYAVYAKEEKTNCTGKKEYKCGKVGHIYRPQIEDANGDKVWGELKIDKDVLSVTIPQKFLDNAAYPVKHAAGLTFGYTTIGGSSSTLSTNNMRGSKGTPASSGTVSQISFYTHYYSGTRNVKTVLVENSGKTIISNGISNSVVVASTAQWFSFTFGTDPSVTGSDIYWIGAVPSASTQYYYDSTGYNSFYDSSNSYSSPTNPTDGDFNGSGIISIYATYTSSGGTTTPPRTLLSLGVGT